MGDDDACREVESWARDIIRFQSYGLSTEDQRDVLQDTLTGLWRAVGQPDFELRHGLKALVRRIATARCIDRLRRRRPETEVPESLPDPALDPYAQLLSSDMHARVRLAVQRLSESCRELIRRHFYEGVAYKVLADAEERAESTIRVRMFGCINKLRAMAAAWE